MNKKDEKMDFLYDVSHRCYLGRKKYFYVLRVNVAAAENEDDKIQGTYGDNLKWSFKDGVFIVSGTGEIPAYFSRKLQKQGNESMLTE